MSTADLKDIVKEVLAESGLNRVYRHVTEHDCAIVTANRSDPFDRSQSATPDFSQEDSEAFGGNPKTANKINNRNLKAYLLKNGYGVTAVDGSYVENFESPGAIEVKEDSLFVVNLNDDPEFFDKVRKCGEKYSQDSVLLIPQGGEGAYLLGTNNSSFPGYGNKVDVGSFHGGNEAEFMTKVRNRPFVFKEGLETYRDLSRNARWCVTSIASKFFRR